MTAEAVKLSPSLFRNNVTAHQAESANDMIENTDETRKSAKKNMHRSFSSMVAFLDDPCQDCASSTDHICQSSESTHATSKAAALEKPLRCGCHFNYMQPSLAPSTSRDALKIPAVDKINGHCSQLRGWSVAWQWSRMRRSIIRRNKAIDGSPQKSATEANHSQGQVFSSEGNFGEETFDPMGQDDIPHFAFSSAYFNRNGSQRIDGEQKRPSKNERQSSISLSHKYQPKSFEDIVGHEINVKVLSNTVQRNKISQIYLFHGPSGTGKTSTAIIFAMALFCESSSFNKPCWTCKGCTRSFYMMQLCSGSRTTGFKRITTLLHCTSFAHALPGFKVFIIEESHSLTAQAWDELLGILENSYNASLVFVLIAADANMIPESVSSRCQKFCFPRLRKMDVTLKLARIVTEEGIRIEEEALKLIVTKAEGSLKEAEYILDQLTLLGPRITTSMVQQLVGLVPQNKLISLLTSAISGDTKTTIITARELVATGVEAEAIVFQLASLITDMITGGEITIPNSTEFAVPSKNQETQEKTQLAYTPSESLCYALKILIEAEKQSRSSFDHITWVYAALLQIASRNVSAGISSGISFPKTMSIPSGDTSHSISMASHHSMSKTYVQQNPDSRDINTSNEGMEKTAKFKGKGAEREFNLACLRDMDEIWLNILERIQNRDMKEFLSSHVKLASLTVSAANAIVHLMFKRTEDKLAAQTCEESMSQALEMAIGCSVVVNMSSEPVELGMIQEYNASSYKCQLAESNQPRKQQYKSFIPEMVYNANPGATTHQFIYPKSGPSSVNSQQLTGINDTPLESKGHTAMETETSSKTLPFSGTVTQVNQLGIYVGSSTYALEKDKFLGDATYITRKDEPKHKWLSLSLFQQNDASVEPYSQDILYENANTDREKGDRKNPKLQKDSSRVHEVHLQSKGESKGLLSSWSCKELLCQKKKSKKYSA